MVSVSGYWTCYADLEPYCLVELIVVPLSYFLFRLDSGSDEELLVKNLITIAVKTFSKKLADETFAGKSLKKFFL